MAAPTHLFLDYNGIDEKWKVLDKDDFPFGSGETPEDAIRSARVVTDAPIYANRDFTGLIDGVLDVPVTYADDLGDVEIYNKDELIIALAELCDFQIRKVIKDGFTLGYTMELIE